MAEEAFRAKKGLEGVIFAETAVSKVVPEKKALMYRGYPVHELATTCSFEEVAYLLWYGELPTASALKEFKQRESAVRAISPELLSLLRLVPKESHPMDSLRTAVSFLGMEEEFKGAEDSEGALRKSFLLLAKISTIVAADFRIRSGKEAIAPRADLSFSENFFWMCFESVPDKAIVSAFDASLTLYAEHGFNASTFTARVTISSLSDICAAVTAAIASLKGPLHGGANEAVMHMLTEVGSAQNAEPWLLQGLKEKKKVMGFGHRLYRIGDSRVPTMKQYRDLLAQHTGQSKWVEISNILEETMIREKNIYPNLDFPAGPTYFMMGFPIPMFTPIFVMARITGWTAHLFEQLADNRLVRPMSAYTGPGERAVTPLQERS